MKKLVEKNNRQVIKLTTLKMMLLGLSFCLVQCSIDDPTENSDITFRAAEAIISGNVSVEESVTNLAPASGVIILLGTEELVSGAIQESQYTSNSLTFVTTTTDADGNYSFVGVPPVQEWMITVVPNERILSAGDESPDGDLDETGFNDRIFVSLSEREHDTDNNFILAPE